MLIRLMAYSGTLFVTISLFVLYCGSLFFVVKPTQIQPAELQSAAAADAPPARRQADEAAIEFFEKRVRPILAANCYECHGDDEQEAGLSVASIDAMLRGGDQGAAIVPGDPDASLLIQGIRYDDAGFQMPPKGKLSTDQIKTLTEWVKAGALGPDASQQQASAGLKKFDLAERAKHWCFQPLSTAAPPPVRDAAWPRSPLDQFVLAKLESAGLHPAAEADPRTLIRRVYFDLVGLPPSVEEVETFVRDAAKDREKAYAAVVDKLLASPHFGERWGRHWLDLVRYAETRGHEFDPVIPNAYHYRDYVIRALNADVPYDQFVKEHLAGDQLPEPRLHPETGANESILGTGFWWLGEEVHSPVDIRQDETDRVDNKIDVFSKTFLGLTLACARCHDHKFDAISTKDYYALSGFVLSMSYRQAAFESEVHNRRIFEQVKQLERDHREALQTAQVELWQPMLEQADKYLAAVRDVAEELKQAGKKTNRAAVITAAANERALDDGRLTAWVEEIERDPRGILASLVERNGEGTNAAAIKAVTSVAKVPPAAALDSPRILSTARGDLDGGWIAGDGLVLGGYDAGGDLKVGSDPTRPLERIYTDDAVYADLNWDVVRVAPEAERDVCRVDWQQANRTLKTKTFTLQTGKLGYFVRGSFHVYAEVASHRINRGPLHGKLVVSSAGPDVWRWVEHDLSAYVGQRVHLEFSPFDAKKLKPGQSEQFALRGIIERPNAASPGEQWSFAVAPQTIPPAGSAIAILTSAVESLRPPPPPEPTGGIPPVGNLPSRVPDSLVAVADWMVQHPELWNTPSAAATKGTETYFAERAKLMAQLKRTSQTAPAAFVGNGVDEHVLVRGQHKTPGELVPRRFLEVFDGPVPRGHHSLGDRLDLAQRLVGKPLLLLDRENPLPARVMVNRVWYHLLGRGIVKTVDNFGSMGDVPTHPELLDHLAREFMQEGWSVKRLIRSIVLSSTYRQASTEARSAELGARNADGENGAPEGSSALRAPSSALLVDPNNELLHRANIKRLDAEIVRDALLATAGRFNPATYGPSVEVHLTPFMEGRGRPGGAGPLDGAGRRSIYLRVRRNFLNPMFLAFDYPTPFTTIGLRTKSNVPAQALSLLNGPLVGEMSVAWAKRLLAEVPGDDATRIDRLYREAFSRPPTTSEAGAAREFLAEQRGLYAATDPNHAAAWTDLCHVLFNVKEFIYIP